MWYYSVLVIEIVWSKYVNWNIVPTYQFMYYILRQIVLFWQIIHLDGIKHKWANPHFDDFKKINTER